MGLKLMLLGCKGISISIWPIFLIPTRYTLLVFIIYSVNNECIYVVSLFSKLVFTGFFGIGKVSKVIERYTANYLQSRHGQVIHVSLLCVCVFFLCSLFFLIYAKLFIAASRLDKTTTLTNYVAICETRYTLFAWDCRCFDCWTQRR